MAADAKMCRAVQDAQSPPGASSNCQLTRPASACPNMSTSTPPARRTQRSTPRAWACAALLAGAALLPLHPARANLDATCNTVAEIFLEDLAATDSGVSAAGCDAAGASAYSICGSRGNAGTCASVSACDDAVDKVISDACTSDNVAGACCTEYLRELPSGSIQTLACLQACPAAPTPDTSDPTTPADRGTPPSSFEPATMPSTSFPPDSTAPTQPTASSTLPSSPGLGTTFTDATCTDLAVDVLETLALENEDYASTSCSTADTGDFCDTMAVAGTCSGNPSCAGAETALADECTSEADDTGCCSAYLAKPCSTCDPAPVLCFQSCVPSGVSGGSPAAGGVSTSSGLSDGLTIVGGSGGSGGGGGGGTASASPESTGAAVPKLGRAVWVVSGAVAAALSALL